MDDYKMSAMPEQADSRLVITLVSLVLFSQIVDESAPVYV